MTKVTAARAGRAYLLLIAGTEKPGDLGEMKMTRMVRTASANFSVFALCFGASMILPVALLAVGFHTL